MSENAADTTVDYSLQHGAGIIVPDAATFIGVGGFGSWAVLFSALSGIKELVLIDASVVDSLDLARAPFFAEHVGLPKAQALELVIKRFRPSASITTVSKAFDPEADAALLKGTVFNGVSGSDTDAAIWRLCQRLGLRCISGVYSGEHIGVMDHLSPSVKLTDNGPVWVVICALSGALGAHAAMKHPMNFLGKVNELDMTIQDLALLPPAVGFQR